MCGFNKTPLTHFSHLITNRTWQQHFKAVKHQLKCKKNNVKNDTKWRIKWEKKQFYTKNDKKVECFSFSLTSTSEY